MVKIEPNETNGLIKISSMDCFQIRRSRILMFYLAMFIKYWEVEGKNND
jgi:hypothetical protein